MRRAFLRLALALLALGCAAPTPVKPPPPPIAPAPQELASLRIHVHQLVTPPETPEDEYDYKHMPGLTRDLRDAFQVALVGAGYVVVVSRRDPRDLVARIQADWPLDGPGVASLTLLDAQGQVIDQLSAIVPVLGKFPHSAQLYDHGAGAMVTAMSRSTKVGALARWLRERGEKKVAAPPEP
jgi:hypothetical protein